jgi:hypothetical protein
LFSGPAINQNAMVLSSPSIDFLVQHKVSERLLYQTLFFIQLKMACTFENSLCALG